MFSSSIFYVVLHFASPAQHNGYPHFWINLFLIFCYYLLFESFSSSLSTKKKQWCAVIKSHSLPCCRVANSNVAHLGYAFNHAKGVTFPSRMIKNMPRPRRWCTSITKVYNIYILLPILLLAFMVTVNYVGYNGSDVPSIIIIWLTESDNRSR